MSQCRLSLLRTERLAAGHSIARLAQLANLRDATITRLENVSLIPGNVTGTCSHEDAVRLSDALGKTLTELGFLDVRN
jgi:hypothetical protein